MSLLTIIQNSCKQLGIASPSIVINNSDSQIQQLRALAELEGQELVRNYNWPALTKEATFTTVASELQGSVSTIFGSDFDRLVPDTEWNRNLIYPVRQISPAAFQQSKARNVQGPYLSFRIKQDPSTYALSLYIRPVPAAGETIAVEYVSKNWVSLAAGGTSDAFAADGDTSLLDEHIITLGVKWRWLEQKGVDYAEAFRTWQNAVNNTYANQVPAPKLNIGKGGINLPLYPPIAPEGSWNL